MATSTELLDRRGSDDFSGSLKRPRGELVELHDKNLTAFCEAELALHHYL